MGETIEEFESDSKPGTYHHIIRGKDGVVYCDCWAWRINKKCKHLDRFFARIVKKLTGTNLVPVAHSDPAEDTKLSGAERVFEAIESEHGIKMWEE